MNVDSDIVFRVLGDHTFAIQSSPDTFRVIQNYTTKCSCGWKSRSYRSPDMANIAGVSHVATIEYIMGEG